jgi:stage V sporulation protein D (sporulation-specific penicillin-binding protein)
VYEMGSIIKPVVMASALDAGAVTPQTTYTDKGFVQVQDRTIYNFDKKGRGTATMQDVLNQSLNTGMVFVEGRMGKELFKTYMLDRFRLGERTGIDLPGEVRGLVSNLNTSNDVNYANAAFGQGIATTPIAIVRAFAALANGGSLIVPHLASAIDQENGERVPLSYEKKEGVIAPETATTITNMLIKVVDEGYGRKMKHFTVAAKTGTAQVAKPNGQGYYDDRNLHSLIGYFPATNPRFVIYFFNYYPKNGGQFAIQTLAGPFFDMIEFLGNYYELTPDR